MFKLRDYQIGSIDNIFADWRNADSTLLIAATGAGKAQPLTEPVLTVDGWKPMGDIAPGDLVIGSNGKPVKVLDVFPQREKQIYRITFSDGSWTRASGDHLWAVQTKSHKCRGSGFKILTTEQVNGDLRDGSGAYKWFLPIVEPIDFPVRELPIEPYLLGALLGDGCLSSEHMVRLSNPDDEVIERVAGLLPADVALNQYKDTCDYAITTGIVGRGRNSLLQDAKESGLTGKLAHEKSIPSEYMIASKAQRLELLRGLMDTDGCMGANGKAPEFCTSSKRLAEQVRDLVRSLGGVTQIRQRSPFYTYKNKRRAGRTSYRITVSLSDCPFYLGRKAETWNANPNQGRTKAIASIDPDGIELCQCILIDSDDHLYVTRGYTLTHNTEIMLGTMDRIIRNEPNARILMIAHRKELIEQPGERIERNWPTLSGRWGVVMADRNDVDAQIIIATVQTLNATGRMDAILEHGPVNYIFTDECHHAVSETYMSVYDHFGKAGAFKHLGVTATPIRSDGAGLSEVYQRIADRHTIDKLIKRGFLCPPRWLAIKTGVSLKGAKKSGSGGDRDYTAKSLRSIFETPQTWRWVVESHKKYAQDRKAIAFTASVDGAYELADEFNKAGIPAGTVCGAMSKADREQVLSDYRSGALQVVTNVAVLTEGFDAPETGCIHMVRPTQSDSYYLQCIGRGLRLFAGKEDALILDYAPVEYRNIKMLGDVLGVKADKAAYMDDNAEPGEVQGGFTFDGEVEWMDGNPMEIISRQLDYLGASPWRWVRESKSDWLVLGLGKGGDEIDRTLVMSPPSARMQLFGIWRKSGERWPKAQMIAEGSFEELAERGEELADKHGQPVLMKKAQRWRNDPPSEGQAKFAKGLGIDVTGMSKGQVANAITRKLALQAIKRTGIQVEV